MNLTKAGSRFEERGGVLRSSIRKINFGLAAATIVAHSVVPAIHPMVASASSIESYAKLNHSPNQATEGVYVVDDKNIAVEKTWTTYAEEARNKDLVYNSTSIRQETINPEVELVYTNDGQGNKLKVKDAIDVDKIVIDQNDGRATFGVFWLGQPNDGEDDAATGDYNDRNGTSYYVVVSRDTKAEKVYVTLKDYDNPDGIETLEFEIGSNEEKTFSTINARKDGDRDNVIYTAKVGAELVNVGYSTEKNGVGGAQNYGVYLLNQLTPDWVGTAVGAGNFTIPTATAQTNSYFLVDGATYNEWLAANEGKTGDDYVSYREFANARGDNGSKETLLAKLEQTGLNGNIFSIADALDYDKYELIESPYDNQDHVNDKLVENFVIGARSQTNSGNNHVKRIRQITDTDGSSKIEIWILDLSHPNAPKSWGDQVARDYDFVDPAQLEEAGFKKLYTTPSLKPGEFNDQWSASDGLAEGWLSETKIFTGGDLIFSAKDRAEVVADNAIDQIRAQVEANPGVSGLGDGRENGNGKVIGNTTNAIYSDRWAYTSAGTTGTTYGTFRVPMSYTTGDGTIRSDDGSTVIAKTSETAANRRMVGGVNIQLVNNTFQNWQEVKYYYVEKGSVIVHYEDMDGNIIKTEVIDEENQTSGEKYDTTDNKPTTITADDGTVYHLVETATTNEGNTVENGVKTSGLPADSIENNKTQTYGTDENGNVVAGTDKHVTYVYQKAGNVEVTYIAVDENGNKIADIFGSATGLDGKTSVEEIENAVKNGKPGSSYNTSSLKPLRITDAKTGKTYELVVEQETTDDSDPEEGEVEAGKTKRITYRYREVVEEPEEETPSTPENPETSTPEDPETPTSETPEESTSTTEEVPAPIKAIFDAVAPHTGFAERKAISVGFLAGLGSLIVLTGVFIKRK